MTGPTGVDVEALADAIELARARWHRTRQARADALMAFQDAMRDELVAAEEFRRATAAYHAHRGWRQ